MIKRKMYASELMRQIESFFWGIIAALGALFIELLIFIGCSISTNPLSNLSFVSLFAVPQFILVAAFVEEFFKYLILVKRIDTYSLAKSYIINSLLVGAGFFAVELGLIISSSNLPSNKILAELAIIHLGTAGIMGYLIALNNPKKLSTFLKAVVLATVFHAGYNFLIFNRELLQNYVITVLLAFLLLANIVNFFVISKKLAQS